MLVWHEFKFLRDFTEAGKVLYIRELKKIYNSMWSGVKLFEVFKDTLLRYRNRINHRIGVFPYFRHCL